MLLTKNVELWVDIISRLYYNDPVGWSLRLRRIGSDKRKALFLCHRADHGLNRIIIGKELLRHGRGGGKSEKRASEQVL